MQFVKCTTQTTEKCEYIISVAIDYERINEIFGLNQEVGATVRLRIASVLKKSMIFYK